MGFGVVLYPVNGDVEFTMNNAAFAVIERDDVRVVVVVEVILIDGQEIGVSAEYNRDVPDCFLMVEDHSSQPIFNQSSLRTPIRVVRIVK